MNTNELLTDFNAAVLQAKTTQSPHDYANAAEKCALVMRSISNVEARPQRLNAVLYGFPIPNHSK
jgi:hypothetical protein